MYVSGWLLCCHEPKYLQDPLHHVLSGPDQDDVFRQDLNHCSGSWQLWWAAVTTITKAQRTLVGRRTKKQVKMCSAWWRPRLEGRRCRTIAMYESSCGRSGTATISAQKELADVAHTFQPRATICCEAGRWSIAWANQRLLWDSLGYPKSYSDSK